MTSLAEALRQAMGAKPATAMGGMAGNAAQAIDGRGYQLAVQESKAMGQKPPTPQEWAAMQRP